LTGADNSRLFTIDHHPSSAINHLLNKHMIQRIQSIWLLLAAGLDAITFKVPFFSGDWIKDKFLAVIDLNATTTIWLSILSIFTGVIALANIFLFKNRSLQLKLCYLGIFLTLALLTLYFLEKQNFIGGTISIWSVFYFAILGCFVLAARGIRKDQKLIKSLDRLR
jgi:hypothetical protein